MSGLLLLLWEDTLREETVSFFLFTKRGRSGGGEKTVDWILRRGE
jgi:hypothetical protein